MTATKNVVEMPRGDPLTEEGRTGLVHYFLNLVGRRAQREFATHRIVASSEELSRALNQTTKITRALRVRRTHSGENLMPTRPYVPADKNKLYSLKKKMQTMLDTAGAAGRDLTTDEAKEFGALMEQAKSIQREIDAQGTGVDHATRVPMTGHYDTPDDSRVHGPRPFIGATYAQLFGGAGDNGGFVKASEFYRAVWNSSQIFDPRLKAAATEGTPGDGGFLVPVEYAARILQRALESAIVMPRAQVWPMLGDALKVPGVSDYKHNDATPTLYGGVIAAWADELETLQDVKVKVEQIGLSASKLGMLANASSELVDDSTYESVLTAKLQEAAQFFLDVAFLFGDGAGKPLGILNAGNPALVTASKDATQAPNSFVYENALAMYSSMAPGCRQRATWVFSDELVPDLTKLQLTVTNKAGTENVGGSATPLFKFNDDGTGVLLGRPVIFTEKMAAAGDLGDAAFICFDQYAVGMRRELRLERSIHAGFASDSIYWRLTTRVDGQSTWSQKLTLKSGKVVSPFVQLEAR